MCVLCNRARLEGEWLAVVGEAQGKKRNKWSPSIMMEMAVLEVMAQHLVGKETAKKLIHSA